ncbi:O-antigen polysaccharide polymerase Wzy, partial [Enterococcus faecium]|nr:O-antigen polysaccharide polymerase Wzy [Enterococcus faecium]
GLVIPYALFGKNVLSEYSDWTLKFLSSPYLAKSVFLGNIAVIVFTLAKGIAMLKPQQTKNNYSIYKWTNSVDSKRMYIAGISLLTLVFFYFVFNILTGGTALVGTYEMYMKSSAYNNSIYAYILILFYVGTIYIASAGKIMEHKFGWFIWLIIAVFLAVNGNKGEFMYSLLAVIGMKGIEGKKISFKLFLIIGIILFILIPSITFLRDIGIAGNLGSAKLKFMDSFLEMGMQIRTSVYTLEDLAANRISTLHGASYYRPILNFIPFLKGPVATLELKNTYLGYGYNQVIESYWNFGIIGPIVFYGILGYILSRIENKVMDREKL